MKLLADHNAEGHLAVVVVLLEGEYWREVWSFLGATCHSIPELGLDLRIGDQDLWQYCQLHDMILVTNNRNQQGPDSLEATIRKFSTPNSLPVFTFGDGDRVLVERLYASKVAEKLLDYLLRIEDLRGSGRLYLP